MGTKVYFHEPIMVGVEEAMSSEENILSWVWKKWRIINMQSQYL